MEPVMESSLESTSASEEVLVTPPDSPAPGPTQMPRLPSLRSSSDTPAVVVPPMTVSSTPLGNLNAARRPGPVLQSSAASIRTGDIPQDVQARLKAFHLSRQGAPPAASLRLPSGGPAGHSLSSNNIRASPAAPPIPVVHADGSSPASPIAAAGPLLGALNPARLAAPGRPPVHNWNSAPIVAGRARAQKLSLGARRGNLPGGLPGALPVGGPATDASGPGAREGNDQASNGAPSSNPAALESGSLFNKFSEYVDTKTGTLRFAGKAVIHGKGIDFSSGSSFSISLDEVENLEELGKGNYGTVYRVRHSRPQMRRPGLGLKGNKRHPSLSVGAGPGVDGVFTPSAAEDAKAESSPDSSTSTPTSATSATAAAGTSGIIMAMKEIHLELDEAKFAAIIMELDVLHRCVSPFIVDFYGAFFQEGAVYICMEYMDGGSIDKLYGDGIPEPVLRKITLSTVMGLKALKDEHNIIHRDVKPTNILVNTRGQVKICDFGVSGNLVASIAKTNIGCQSYMAPERIASGGVAQAGANPGGGTYSVQSDIWSLGLTIIECAMGRYPYAPETYNNIFSQLSAIVDGEPPDLPEEGFSEAARDFVRGCLNKIPKLRPTYAMLLRHGWFAELLKPPTISEGEAEAEAEAAPSSAASEPNASPLSAAASEPSASPSSPSSSSSSAQYGGHSRDTADDEVAQWARDAIERRKMGSSMSKRDKPALHAAPLDARAQPAS